MRFAAILALLTSAGLPGQTYDLILRGGRIVDGTGSPWYIADVAIQGDAIAVVGPLTNASAKRVLNVKGLTVAPGFIDIHTHSRRGIEANPTAENYVRQGVTTLIEGNDGGSPLPIGAFLDKLPRTSVNFGTFVGQGSIRQAVTGLENRKATIEEILKMKDLARQAMRDGALGMSTGLFYVPGNFTPTEEVIELAKAVASMGGMHISHMRDEAAAVLDSVREIVRIGEEGGLPTQVTHHKIIGSPNWGRSVDTLRLIDEARARGVDVSLDQYPYTASSTGTAALLPQWSQAGGQKQLVARLHEPATRARIKAYVVENIKINRGGGDPKNVFMANCSWDHSLDGKHLAQITDERGRTPSVENAAETALEIQEKGGCAAVYHSMGEEDLERILRYPATMIGSDGEIPEFGKGAPHPRSYGTFARVLGRYVRERKTLTLEDAIRRMTALPSARLRLLDRGTLRPGMRADIAVFDSAAVADKATFQKPHQYAEGFRHVIVNGTPVLLDGKITAERPGQVLRSSNANSRIVRPGIVRSRE